MTSALIRFTLVAIALVATAWLALSLRAVELEAEGRTVLRRVQDGPIAPGEVDRGRSLLRRARAFSADEGPLITESLLLATVDRRREAARLARRVVADEPDNLEGWIVLYLASRDPRALRAVRALNPWAAEVLR